MDDVMIQGPATGTLVTLIHGWPDDLHLWDDLVSDLLSTGNYRCLRFTLPGYGNSNEKNGVVDPNFHEVANIAALVVRQHQHHDDEKSILIVHDWGSVVGFNLQRLHPQLFSKMVVLDVGPLDHDNASKFAEAAGVIGMGLYYQWFNSAAYFTWRYVPFIGEWLGDAMHQIQVRRFKQFPDGRVHPRANLKQSASAAYFYHYYQANFWLDDFLPFSLRGGSPLPKPPSDPLQNPSVPTLFLHGSTSGSLGRLFRTWKKMLHKRKDSDVAVVRGDHWFMLWSPKETSAAVLKWLEFGDQGGKLNHSFKDSLLRSKM